MYETSGHQLHLGKANRISRRRSFHAACALRSEHRASGEIVPRTSFAGRVCPILGVDTAFVRSGQAARQGTYSLPIVVAGREVC